MQNLLAFGLLTTSISAQTTLQQYVDCDPDTETGSALWTGVPVNTATDAATCETELNKLIAAHPDLSPYTACAGYKMIGGVLTCGYYYALTAENPTDIRVGKTVDDGMDMWAAYYIGSATPVTDLAGIPLGATEEGAVAVTDSASRICGAIMAVLATVAMIQ